MHQMDLSVELFWNREYCTQVAYFLSSWKDEPPKCFSLHFNEPLCRYESLGLKSAPNKSDNGVHASASPFEGLAEKCNWLGLSIQKIGFGKALLKAGLSARTIRAWSLDPRVKLLNDDGEGSIFDALEDMDAKECLDKLVELNKVNS